MNSWVPNLFFNPLNILLHFGHPSFEERILYYIATNVITTISDNTNTTTSDNTNTTVDTITSDTTISGDTTTSDNIDIDISDTTTPDTIDLDTLKKLLADIKIYIDNNNSITIDYQFKDIYKYVLRCGQHHLTIDLFY